MKIGEIIIFIFIVLVFAGMIYVGVRLLKWNKKDRAEKAERNKKARKLREKKSHQG